MKHQITVEIPESVAEAIRLPRGELEAELRKELAIALYRRKMLSEGKSAELAGIGRLEFANLLGERGVERNYDLGDLRHDLEWAARQNGTGSPEEEARPD